MNRDELLARRQLVEVLQSQFDKIDALFKAGRQGGSADQHELAAYELSVAQGNLALALGDRKQALVRSREASDHADQAFKAVQAAYAADRVTLDLLLQAARNQSEAKLRLIHLQESMKQPASAGSHNEKSNASHDSRYVFKLFLSQVL